MSYREERYARNIQFIYQFGHIGRLLYQVLSQLSPFYNKTAIGRNPKSSLGSHYINRFKSYCRREAYIDENYLHEQDRAIFEITDDLKHGCLYAD